MENQSSVRWLKAIYVCNVVVSGSVGIGMILLPNTFQSVFRLPPQDPVMLGLGGSLFFAIGLVSIFGLRSPLKFAPVFLPLLKKVRAIYTPVSFAHTDFRSFSSPWWGRAEERRVFSGNLLPGPP